MKGVGGSMEITEGDLSRSLCLSCGMRAGREREGVRGGAMLLSRAWFGETGGALRGRLAGPGPGRSRGDMGPAEEVESIENILGRRSC